MMPNLMIGDFVIAKKFPFSFKKCLKKEYFYSKLALHRGDVVIFNYKESRNTKYVKRIVGIPGDIV